MDCLFYLVREKGLEPSRPKALAPKASVSTIPPLAPIMICGNWLIIPNIPYQIKRLMYAHNVACAIINIVIDGWGINR